MILPCPFCKSTDVGYGSNAGQITQIWIMCADCCAEGPIAIDEEAAAQKWNKAGQRIAALEAENAALKASVADAMQRILDSAGVPLTKEEELQEALNRR